MTSSIIQRSFLLAGAAFALAAPARAHITLENQQAAVGSSYKAVFRVPHGCAGAATVKVRVQVPEGVIAVKPKPKPGWELATIKGAYKQPYDYFGTAMSEGVREVSWSGRLLDENYDEFVLRAYLTPGLAAPQTLYWPTVQECEGGKAERWIEIPAADKAADDYKFPAPGVKLAPKPTN